MTTLSRSFTNGALAIAGAAAVLGFGGVAQAFTLGEALNPTFSFRTGDKVVSNFSITGTSHESVDTLTFSTPTPGLYQLNYDSLPGSNPLTSSGSLSYTITIDPLPNASFFDKAQTDAQGGGQGLGGTYSKTLTPTGLSPTTLTATEAGNSSVGSFTSPLKVINVTDTWTPGANSFVNSFSDKFTQNPITPLATPEPSAVLGMLALGLTGVLVRRQKG